MTPQASPTESNLKEPAIIFLLLTNGVAKNKIIYTQNQGDTQQQAVFLLSNKVEPIITRCTIFLTNKKVKQTSDQQSQRARNQRQHETSLSN